MGDRWKGEVDGTAGEKDRAVVAAPRVAGLDRDVAIGFSFGLQESGHVDVSLNVIKKYE